MRFAQRCLLRRVVTVSALFLFSLPLWAAERIRVDDYKINAEIIPRAHRLIGQARVQFTALEDVTAVSFELHNALRPSRITDESGRVLPAERLSQDSSVRVTLPSILAKDQSMTLIFDYDGVLNSADESPVQGLKLASIADDTAYLLYAGRWFPVVGYGTNRFKATMNITVPSNWVVIGSGKETDRVGGVNLPIAAPASAAPVEDIKDEGPPKLVKGKKVPLAAKKASPKPAAPAPATVAPANRNVKTYTFVWDQSGFPGTIIAGTFEQSMSNAGGVNLRVYYKPEKKEAISKYEETATREFQFFSGLWGAPLSTNLKLVQLPDDTVPYAWSEEIAALSGRNIASKMNYRLLANAIAHQWWGASVSPASKNDWWLADGFARYGEARYVQDVAGAAAFEEVSKDLSVGALAYDTVPLSSIGKMDVYSPEFQSLVTDKGAVILNMLHWVVGDAAFEKTILNFATQFKGKSATVDDFRNIAEENYGDKLTWFFTQWINSTGAPEFKSKYTVYRLGTTGCNDPAKCKGFRIVGEVSQDLDLFRMPVEIKVDTDGKTETDRIDVVGTNSAFSIETFGRPRRVSIDPENRVLKNSSELKIRAAILRGQGLVQQGDLAEALGQFQKALEFNKNSSLGHYRIAEVFFLQHNYQAAANAYRESLNGDGEPRWTEVWSHIQLGKIFDVTGQRERATNEYRQAIQTNDDTQGALTEARKYLTAPFAGEKTGPTNGD